MSDDLKQRLRKFETVVINKEQVWYRNPDGPEAADRIEQLEAALQEIADLGFWDGDRAMDIARAALEGKTDD